MSGKRDYLFLTVLATYIHVVKTAKPDEGIKLTWQCSIRHSNLVQHTPTDLRTRVLSKQLNEGGRHRALDILGLLE